LARAALQMVRAQADGWAKAIQSVDRAMRRKPTRRVVHIAPATPAAPIFVPDSPSAPVVLSEELTATELPDEEERAQGWAKVEALLAELPDPSTLVREEPAVTPMMPGSSSRVVQSLMGSMYRALNDTNEQLNKATSMLEKGIKMLADANGSIAVLNDTYDTLEEYLHSS
jgi:hypothetical protein